MILMFTYLFFVVYVNTVSTEVIDDVAFEMVSRRIDDIDIRLIRIARQQKRILETRINDKGGVRNNDCCKESQKEKELNLDITNSSLEFELTGIKRAISSEKEYVRRLEKKLETYAAGPEPPSGFNRRAEEAEEIANMSKAMENRMEAMEKGLDTVETTSSSLLNKVDSLEKKLGSVETTSDDIGGRVDSMELSISSLVLASAKKVSFSAQFRPVDGTAVIFQKGTIIPFNHVIYNDGSGYNGTTGIFTVPVSGVYQFIFFVEGWQTDEDFSCPTAVAVLYVDGKGQAAAFAESMHVKQNTQAGNAYINYFNKGQKVLIGTAESCDDYTIFAYRTTFSGVLLY